MSACACVCVSLWGGGCTYIVPTLLWHTITLHTQKHRNLRAEHEALAENYAKLHRKSRDIIATLQHERDSKIVECEELRTQVGDT